MNDLQIEWLDIAKELCKYKDFDETSLAIQNEFKEKLKKFITLGEQLEAASFELRWDKLTRDGDSTSFSPPLMFFAKLGKVHLVKCFADVGYPYGERESASQDLGSPLYSAPDYFIHKLIKSMVDRDHASKNENNKKDDVCDNEVLSNFGLNAYYIEKLIRLKGEDSFNTSQLSSDTRKLLAKQAKKARQNEYDDDSFIEIFLTLYDFIVKRGRTKSVYIYTPVGTLYQNVSAIFGVMGSYINQNPNLKSKLEKGLKDENRQANRGVTIAVPTERGYLPEDISVYLNKDREIPVSPPEKRIDRLVKNYDRHQCGEAQKELEKLFINMSYFLESHLITLFYTYGTHFLEYENEICKYLSQFREENDKTDNVKIERVVEQFFLVITSILKCLKVKPADDLYRFLSGNILFKNKNYLEEIFSLLANEEIFEVLRQKIERKEINLSLLGSESYSIFRNLISQGNIKGILYFLKNYEIDWQGNGGGYSIFDYIVELLKDPNVAERKKGSKILFAVFEALELSNLSKFAKVGQFVECFRLWLSAGIIDSSTVLSAGNMATLIGEHYRQSEAFKGLPFEFNDFTRIRTQDWECLLQAAEEANKREQEKVEKGEEETNNIQNCYEILLSDDLAVKEENAKKEEEANINELSEKEIQALISQIYQAVDEGDIKLFMKCYSALPKKIKNMQETDNYWDYAAYFSKAKCRILPYCVKMNRPNFVRYLVLQNAPFWIKDGNGNLPSSYATNINMARALYWLERKQVTPLLDSIPLPELERTLPLEHFFLRLFHATKDLDFKSGESRAIKEHIYKGVIEGGYTNNKDEHFLELFKRIWKRSNQEPDCTLCKKVCPIFIEMARYLADPNNYELLNYLFNKSDLVPEFLKRPCTDISIKEQPSFTFLEFLISSKNIDGIKLFVNKIGVSKHVNLTLININLLFRKPEERECAKEIVELLGEKILINNSDFGYDINYYDCYIILLKETLLYMAHYESQLALSEKIFDLIYEHLLHNGPQSTRDTYYANLLSQCVKSNNLQFLNFLLIEKGVNPCIKDGKGKKPIEYASENNNHDEISEALDRLERYHLLLNAKDSEKRKIYLNQIARHSGEAAFVISKIISAIKQREKAIYGHVAISYYEALLKSSRNGVVNNFNTASVNLFFAQFFLFIALNTSSNEIVDSNSENLKFIFGYYLYLEYFYNEKPPKGLVSSYVDVMKKSLNPDYMEVMRGMQGDPCYINDFFMEKDLTNNNNPHNPVSVIEHADKKYEKGEEGLVESVQLLRESRNRKCSLVISEDPKALDDSNNIFRHSYEMILSKKKLASSDSGRTHYIYVHLGKEIDELRDLFIEFSLILEFLEAKEIPFVIIQHYRSMAQFFMKEENYKFLPFLSNGEKIVFNKFQIAFLLEEAVSALNTKAIKFLLKSKDRNDPGKVLDNQRSPFDIINEMLRKECYEKNENLGLIGAVVRALLEEFGEEEKEIKDGHLNIDKSLVETVYQLIDLDDKLATEVLQFLSKFPHSLIKKEIEGFSYSNEIGVCESISEKCARLGKNEIIAELIKMSINPNVSSKDGKKPIDSASQFVARSLILLAEMREKLGVGVEWPSEVNPEIFELRFGSNAYLIEYLFIETKIPPRYQNPILGFGGASKQSKEFREQLEELVIKARLADYSDEAFIEIFKLIFQYRQKNKKGRLFDESEKPYLEMLQYLKSWRGPERDEIIKGLEADITKAMQVEKRTKIRKFDTSTFRRLISSSPASNSKENLPLQQFLLRLYQTVSSNFPYDEEIRLYEKLDDCFSTPICLGPKEYGSKCEEIFFDFFYTMSEYMCKCQNRDLTKAIIPIYIEILVYVASPEKFDLLEKLLNSKFLDMVFFNKEKRLSVVVINPTTKQPTSLLIELIRQANSDGIKKLIQIVGNDISKLWEIEGAMGLISATENFAPFEMIRDTMKLNLQNGKMLLGNLLERLNRQSSATALSERDQLAFADIVGILLEAGETELAFALLRTARPKGLFSEALIHSNLQEKLLKLSIEKQNFKVLEALIMAGLNPFKARLNSHDNFSLTNEVVTLLKRAEDYYEVVFLTGFDRKQELLKEGKYHPDEKRAWLIKRLLAFAAHAINEMKKPDTEVIRTFNILKRIGFEAVVTNFSPLSLGKLFIEVSSYLSHVQREELQRNLFYQSVLTQYEKIMEYVTSNENNPDNPKRFLEWCRENKAVLTVKDRNGHSLYHYACDNKAEEIITYMEENNLCLATKYETHESFKKQWKDRRDSTEIKEVESKLADDDAVSLHAAL